MSQARYGSIFNTTHLRRHQVRCDRGVGGKYRGQQHAHVSDIDRQVDRVQGPVNDGRGCHEARVDRPTNDTTQWVPSPIVEPVQEIIESLGRKVFRRAKVLRD